MATWYAEPHFADTYYTDPIDGWHTTVRKGSTTWTNPAEDFVWAVYERGRPRRRGYCLTLLAAKQAATRALRELREAAEAAKGDGASCVTRSCK